MEALRPWKQHFSIPADQSHLALRDCLVSNLINESEYLNWAMAYYQKPSLSKTDGLPLMDPARLWLEYNLSFNWSEECLPLATWDGHLIVGCLEPQNNLPQELNAIQILCSYTHLKLLWQTYQKSKSLKLRIPDLNSSLNASAAHFENSAPLTPNLNATTARPPESQMPEGLSWNSSSSADKPESKHHEDSANFLEDLEKTMSQSEFQPQPASGEIHAEPLDTELPPEISPYEELSLEQPEGISLAEIQREPVTLTKTVIPEFNQTAVTNPTEGNSGLNKINLQSAVEPLSTVKSGSYPVTIDQTPNDSWLEKIQAKNSQMFHQICENLFSSLSAYFEQILILSYNDLSLTVKTLKWNDHFPSNVAIKKYDISTPNIFRIVAMSEKPFHGAPIMNDFNENFFEEWHSGEIPNHLTVIPLIVNGKIIGMMYAAGPKSSYTSHALKFSESKSQHWLDELVSKIATSAA